MNYKRIYDNLIDRAKHRILECYTETHHITPKCMGGSDNKNNLVDLTPEEHYLAHQLLVRIYPNNNALIKAAMMMTVNRSNNKIYGWLRRKHSNAMSLSQLGDSNSQYGTRWIHNLQLQKSKKILKSDPLPQDWREGRVINFDKQIDLLKEQTERIEKDKQFVKEIMYYYRDNDISMRKLAKKFNVGHNVYKRFERYFKEEYAEIVKKKKGNSNVAKKRYTDS